jgi:GABA permease
MRNPIRSEADAFRFVWATIGYFALIVLGSLIARWVGLVVFVVLTAGVLWWILRRRQGEAPVQQAPAASPPGEHRILVIANETVGGAELLSVIRQRSDARTRVLVVCPALNSPIRHWASDEDGARAAAQARLDLSLAAMLAAGVVATGEIGDGDPIQAIEDAVRTFQPDELIISTHPAGRSHWLERGVVEKTRTRFALPLTHVVVDVDSDQSSQ